MQKIVINRRHGGFGLSHEAVMRYAEIKGITLYPEQGPLSEYAYYVVPKDERLAELPIEDWLKLPQDERDAYNEAYEKQTVNNYNLQRDDPALVQVVEELGDKASGGYARLKVVEIPDGVQWEIKEYDGKEWVAEVHRTWI